MFKLALDKQAFRRCSGLKEVLVSEKLYKEMRAMSLIRFGIRKKVLLKLCRPESDVELLLFDRLDSNVILERNLYKVVHEIKIPDGKPDRTAAEQGDSAAQYHMGLCCRFGRYVERNDDEAIKWVRLSADSGNADAQLYLGISYLGHYVGVHIPRNEDEGILLIQKAAEQGNSVAEYIYGLFLYYKEPEIIDSEYVKKSQRYRGKKFLTCAAEHGSKLEMEELDAIMKIEKASRRVGKADILGMV